MLLLLVSIFACKKETSKELLELAIKEYETERTYDFKRNESVENTIAYYQQESDFATQLLEKLSKIEAKDLSDTDQISLELLAFTLQDKVRYSYL